MQERHHCSSQGLQLGETDVCTALGLYVQHLGHVSSTVQHYGEQLGGVKLSLVYQLNFTTVYATNMKCLSNRYNLQNVESNQVGYTILALHCIV